VERELAIDDAYVQDRQLQPQVIVPVSRLDKPTLQAIAFAHACSPDAVAVHVANDREEGQRFRRAWLLHRPQIELVIVESPFRVLLRPLLAYIDAVDAHDPERPVTVVL